MSECTTLNTDPNVMHLLQEIIKGMKNINNDIQELKKHLIPASIITDKYHTQRVGRRNKATKKRRVRRVNTTLAEISQSQASQSQASQNNIIKLTTTDKTQDSKNGVSYEELRGFVSKEITKMESEGNNEPDYMIEKIVKIKDDGEIDGKE
jgi:hypothetical protein